MKKQGISLIVLVITIIVMIILAGTVLMTLSDTGIIGAANDTVNKSNKIEVTEFANLVWVEEYMSGKRDKNLKDAVLERLDEYKDKYTIGVTNKGVTVKDKNESLDEDEDMSGDELLGPDNGGLYSSTGSLIASWETLENTYGLDAEKDYSTENLGTEPGTLKYIIDNNPSLASATHLVISNRISRVGDGALCQTALKKITVPSNVKILGDMSLTGAELEEIVLSEGLEIIGNAALGLSIKLSSILVPSTVTAIGDFAFAAAQITSLHIPEAVTYLGEQITWGSNNLTSLTVSTLNPNYKAVDNVIFSKDGTVLSEAIMTKTGTYRIPDGVVTLRAGAFCGTGTSKIIVPASVEIIENNVFEENKFTSIEFETGSRLKSVGDYAFMYACNLVEVIFPEGLTTIGNKLFVGSNIQRITLPSTIKTIGKEAFITTYTSETLQKLTINATTPPTISANAIDVTAQIVVPTGCANAYKTAAGWSTYADKIVEGGQ